MNRSGHARTPGGAATSSQFTWATGPADYSGYWASGLRQAPGRAPRRTSIQLASDILAPLGAAPCYYALAWQFLLWLACTVLVLMMFV